MIGPIFHFICIPTFSQSRSIWYPVHSDALGDEETEEVLLEPREEEEKEDFRLGSSQLLIFTEGRLPSLRAAFKTGRG